MDTVSKEELDKITDFIERETYKMKYSKGNIMPSNILILMPNWLLRDFRTRYKVNIFSSDDDLPTAFFGHTIQSHYKDEVVIYYKDYHFNPKLFEPVIYTIN